jgi:endonuclease/exonuclease/phosphatase family metal-dependent hydrolase
MPLHRRRNPCCRQLAVIAVLLVNGGWSHLCRADRDPAAESGGIGEGSFVVMTFNTGTTPGLSHDDPPHDGYGSTQAAISDTWYGNALAWRDAVDAVRRFIRKVDPDIVAFQEIFYCEDCANIPADARKGFICETWSAGDASVARNVLGEDYQISCHPGKPNKCVAVHRRFGTFRGYKHDASTNWLEGFPLKGCGSGARVARATIDRANGESLTVISVHGTSGLSSADQRCRIRQIEQIFVDFGDGAPAANGAQNIVLGDFNSDPGRGTAIDSSAARWNDFVGEGKRFQFISKVGPKAPRAYQRFADIDHVISDVFHGACRYPGVDEGSARVFDGVYFDHVPVVCTISK